VVSDRFSVLVNVFEAMFIYPPICRLIDLDAVQGAMQRAAQPAAVGPTAAQRRVAEKVVDLAKAESWLDLSVMAGDALRTARELREVEPQWAAVIYDTFGTCYYSLGQHAKAKEMYEQGLAIFKELGDRAGQAASLDSLGNCYQVLGQHAKAKEMYEQSLAFEKELGDRAGQGKLLGRLGNCYESLGQHAKAKEMYEQGLAIKKELGDRAGQGETLHGLGSCYRSLCQHAKAMELYEQGLAIFKELGDRAGQGKTLDGLGNCYFSVGQQAKAIDLFEKSLSIKEELGDHAGQAATLHGLGKCYHSLGQHAKAIDLFKKSLAIKEQLGDRVRDRAGQGKSLNGLGHCYESLGQHATAMEQFEKALVIYKHLEDSAGQGASLNAGQGASLNGLGICNESLGQHAKAMELFEQSLAIFKELGDRAGQGASYNNLGDALDKSGDFAAAARALVEGIVVWQEMEQDLGAHDDCRVSVFEEQQKTYRLLQGVLLGRGGQAAGWALGVASEGKGRALAYRLGAGGGGGGPHYRRDVIGRVFVEDGLARMDRLQQCRAWWGEVQTLARAEGAVTRVLEYSFLSDDKLAIWVVSGETGELLCSKVVASTGLGGSRERSIKEVLREVRSSMKVRGRDGIAEIRGRLFSYLLKRGSRPAAGGTKATAPLPYPRYVLRGLFNTPASRAPCARRGLLASLLSALAWQEYAATFADSPGLECTQVRRGRQNIPSQAAPAQTITFLPGCTSRSAASLASVSLGEEEKRNFNLFENFPTEVLLNYVFPQLDFMSLMNLLYSCKSFCNLEVMHPQRTAARSSIIKTVLQQINILDACEEDLKLILKPERIEDWMRDDDEPPYFDVCNKHGVLQHTALYPIQDDHPQTGTFGVLGRKPPDHDNDGALEWFTHMVERVLEEIRDEVLDSELHNPPADHLTIQTEKVCAALNRKRYASLTSSRTEGSSFSVFDQLCHVVEQRRALLLDLHGRLQDVNETLLFHSILYKLSKKELESVEEWIEEWIGIYRHVEMEPTRNATERAKPSREAEREEIIRMKNWALEMLQKLRVKSFEREKGGVVGYCNKISPRAQSYAVSERAKVNEAWEVLRRKQRAEEIASETSLLKELYAALIAPVEEALKGAEELLIVPHKELFEVPWAALTDADGGYLIERHVIRTAPSLRVARQAADKMETSGHVVLVGNPLPIPQRFRPLNFAAKEVDSIYKILNNLGMEVLPEHHFRENSDPPAIKTNVKNSLQDAAWAHMALHGDLETDSLVLAIPAGADQDTDSGLSMPEVQGSVQMAPGATVVLSACNTGRGKIMAEGVVGLARGFLMANASATVGSLWSVDDGSTAALMRIKYQHLAQGCTVPQALRLAMLRLACRPDRLALPHAGEVERNKQVARPPTPVVPMFVHTRKYVEEPLFLSRGPVHDVNPLFSPHKACLMQNRPAGGRDPEACESLEACQQGRQAARDSEQCLELVDFRRPNGDGARGSSGGGSGGVLAALQPFIEMYEMVHGGTRGASRCAPISSAASHPDTGTYLCETENQRWQYWRDFCKRKVAPTCVLDFAYQDSKNNDGLRLVSDDDKLLERMYCFEDLEDGGKQRRVILKVHTLRKWKDRNRVKLSKRASKVTAVKFTYAYWNPSEDKGHYGELGKGMFEVGKDRQLLKELLKAPVTEAERLRKEAEEAWKASPGYLLHKSCRTPGDRCLKNLYTAALQKEKEEKEHEQQQLHHHPADLMLLPVSKQLQVTWRYSYLRAQLETVKTIIPHLFEMGNDRQSLEAKVHELDKTLHCLRDNALSLMNEPNKDKKKTNKKKNSGGLAAFQNKLLSLKKQVHHRAAERYEELELSLEPYGELEWEWRKNEAIISEQIQPVSMPSLDPDTDDGKVKELYLEVSAAIRLGESMFYRRANDGAFKEVVGLEQVLPLFFSIPPFLLRSPSPSHSHVPPTLVSIKLYFFQKY
jgi:CHAT domain-containing protein/tetratricopeptide (TPR) repeat protein